MAKVQLKSDNIKPFGGIIAILKTFNSSGIQQLIDNHLGKRCKTKKGFSYGDIFSSLFVN